MCRLLEVAQSPTPARTSEIQQPSRKINQDTQSGHVIILPLLLLLLIISIIIITIIIITLLLLIIIIRRPIAGRAC